MVISTNDLTIATMLMKMRIKRKKAVRKVEAGEAEVGGARCKGVQ